MPKTTGYAEAVEQDVHSTSTIARAKLGEKVQTADGRTYRYARAAGTALAAGKLTVVPTLVANHTNIAVAAAADVGATQITVTLGATAATANQYAEGYVVINDAAGEGIAYKIRDHLAADASASLVLNLEDSIKVALTTSSEASLQYNLYDQLVISATDQADMPVGIPNVAVAANEYFWVQTGGTCAALADAAVAAGLNVTTGTGTAGAVQAVALTEGAPNTGAAQPIVGVAINALVDTEYRPVRLTLDT